MEGEPPCKSIKSTHPPLPLYDTLVTGMNQAAQALAAAAESPSSAAKLQADSWLSRIYIIDLWVEHC